MSHLGLLLTAASAWTGFRPQAISRERVLRVAHSLGLTGLTSRELEERLERREPELLQRLAEALAVGETYFFRQQDHFHFITREVIPARLSSGVRHFRAWSAGCATGEEAWSLAACLRAALPREQEVEVHGTDLLERHVEAARLGRYRKWSVRGPQPLPVLRRRGEDFEVDEQLRSRVTFHVENLLVPHADPSPRYDLVLCRNVLVYFSPEAARLALRNILALMAPGGYLLLGPADAQELPEELVRVGDAGLQAFVRGFPARPVPRVFAAVEAGSRPGASPGCSGPSRDPFPRPRLLRPPPSPGAVRWRSTSGSSKSWSGETGRVRRACWTCCCPVRPTTSRRCWSGRCSTVVAGR